MSGASPVEVMTIAAARALRDDDVCFVGIGAPSAAANLARLTHAPNITLIYESGPIGARPDVLPLSIGDGELSTSALTTVSVPEMFAYWLQGGRITVGFLGAAQVDRYGNLNTTVIGDHAAPTVRLPGAGGAPEIATGCGRTYIVVRHAARTLVPALDFRTSLGFGDGGRDRSDLGVATAGPVKVITDLAVLEPDSETRELVVTAIQPGVTPRDVVDATGWPLRFADGARTAAPPTDSELVTLRDLHGRTRVAHGGPV